jgi:phosphatidylglycerophosphate synthase
VFDHNLRQVKDRVGAPIALRLGRLSPNIVTFVAFFVGLGSAALAAGGLYIWALVFWAINRLLDGLDGLIARVHHRQSDLGGYLDIVMDHVIYAAVPIGMVIGTPSAVHHLALAFMLAAFYVNSASWMYLVAILEKRNARENDQVTSIVMPAGLIGGAETIIAYCLFLLFPSWMGVLFSLFGILVLLTTAQRLIWAWRNFS